VSHLGYDRLPVEPTMGKVAYPRGTTAVVQAVGKGGHVSLPSNQDATEYLVGGAVGWDIDCDCVVRDWEVSYGACCYRLVCGGVTDRPRHWRSGMVFTLRTASVSCSHDVSYPSAGLSSTHMRTVTACSLDYIEKEPSRRAKALSGERYISVPAICARQIFGQTMDSCCWKTIHGTLQTRLMACHS
jgi:hypothetical protein